MSYTIGKYILWILLCIPVFAALCLMLDNLLDDVINSNNSRKTRRSQAALSRQRRRQFDMDYSEKHGGFYE